MRIGLGTDVHRLVVGRPLVLGGVTLESELGADGHSDADALTHAVTDAIFGALASGDIGSHFPDGDERWRNAESFVFLRFAIGLMKGLGYEVANLDSVIELEKPKLRDHIDTIRESLANTLGVPVDRISVKAKTGEGLGEVGRCEAVIARAVVLLVRSDEP